MAMSKNTTIVSKGYVIISGVKVYCTVDYTPDCTHALGFRLFTPRGYVFDCGDVLSLGAWQVNHGIMFAELASANIVSVCNNLGNLLKLHKLNTKEGLFNLHCYWGADRYGLDVPNDACGYIKWFMKNH